MFSRCSAIPLIRASGRGRGGFHGEELVEEGGEDERLKMEVVALVGERAAAAGAGVRLGFGRGICPEVGADIPRSPSAQPASLSWMSALTCGG